MDEVRTSSISADGEAGLCAGYGAATPPIRLTGCLRRTELRFPQAKLRSEPEGKRRSASIHAEICRPCCGCCKCSPSKSSCKLDLTQVTQACTAAALVPQPPRNSQQHAGAGDRPRSPLSRTPSPRWQHRGRAPLSQRVISTWLGRGPIDRLALKWLRSRARTSSCVPSTASSQSSISMTA